MAASIIFICLCAFMFNAGYQWRKWEGTIPNRPPQPTNRDPRESLLEKI